MLPLTYFMRRRIETRTHRSAPCSRRRARQAELPFSPATLQVLLFIAGIACCVAMSMPQVHLVAYCGDLGYGAARGAEMLSLMLASASSAASPRASSPTASAACARCCSARCCKAWRCCSISSSTGSFSLYVISGLFGLFQGGIVPSYAIIVREYFSPKEASTRVGLVVMATVFGMALGGWMSGAIFDATGSYQAAFLNGLAWNLLNVSIASWLLLRTPRRTEFAHEA